MIKFFTKRLLWPGVFACIIATTSYSQTTVSGTVTDARSGEPLVGVNIVVKGKVVGTITDFDGNFKLTTQDEPPVTLIFSIIGYATQELDIPDSDISGITIAMEEEAILGQEVVVSASRVQESILESPVSIEKMDILDIQNAAAPSFYDAIGNLQGVDFSAQSLTFKSINTRGFGSNGNTRFVQLIDGIDNQAPGLNFPVGNIVGISDLDLESAELIPGAASALYGPNAIQGILLLNSKSPFEYQGLSASAKIGVNHVDGEDDDPSPYQEYALRYAKAINNKWAFKITGSYLRANDFRSVDFRDQSDIVERGVEVDPTQVGYRQDPNVPRDFDGVSIYGDPVINIGEQLAGSSVASLAPTDERGNFTPTGFTESSFVDNTTESIKAGAALHYRINDDLEVFGQFNWGSGSTVYTANDRFVLDNFTIWTSKLELRASNFFLRAYTTQENSGDSYAANTVASLINLDNYAGDYINNFVGARLGGQSIDASHAFARTQADAAQAFYAPGTPRFDFLVDSLRSLSIAEGGAAFRDESDLWHYEGSYNFSEITDALGIVVGANYRRYALQSQGTLFALEDNGDEVDIDEWGAYVQLSDSYFDDRLKIQISGRYDKNENFDGQFSPRASAVYTVAGDHNFRASFQRGFRIPTTQDQFIDLDVVTRRLIGSNELLVDRYNFRTNTVYNTNDVQRLRDSISSGVLTSAEAAARLEPETRVFNEFKTEKVNTFEIGYKGLWFDNRLLVDAYYYYSIYNDFIAEIDFTQAVDATDTDNSDGFAPAPGFETGANPEDVLNNTVPGGRLQRYGFDVNADGNVESNGWGLQLEYNLPRGYKVGGNVSYNRLISQQDLIDQGFLAQYNTPEYRYNISFANREVIDNLGFNVVWRWQQAFLWQSAIGESIIPEFGTLDAQVSYRVPSLKSILKIGGSNVLNERYTTSHGNPRMGAIYYFQITFDEFFN